MIHSLSRRAAAAALGLALVLGASAALAQTNPRVKIATSMGDIVVELYPDKAPNTVANFLQYVRDKHYDGTIFHRVINNFMIQGGGMDENMVERKTRPPIQHEGKGAVAKGLRNEVGVLAMARTGDPHSATSQFFINVVDNKRLDPILLPPGDPIARFEFGGRVYENVPRSQLENAAQLWGYTPFGKVVSGMDVVEKIKAVQTGDKGMHQNVPLQPVLITSATVVK